ncbi:hypothetical protein CLCAR_3997 [Clostridium carboxidivorans P7]|nr:hypothetical protein CLCAR_3997 [Clostridium carboxidivorans P7]
MYHIIKIIRVPVENETVLEFYKKYGFFIKTINFLNREV